MSDEFDRILSATPIESVIGQYVTLIKAGKNFKAKCPFHGDKTPSFYVWTGVDQGCMCFGCGVGGDAVDFLTELTSMPKVAALQEIARIGGLEPPVFRKKSEPELRREGLAEAIWKALPLPLDEERDVFGARLVKAGWPIRTFDAGIIDRITTKTDRDELDRLGLAVPVENKMLSAIPRAWVFAGRRIASTDDTPTGFLVIEQQPDRTLRVRSRAKPVKGSVIANDSVRNRWKTFDLDAPDDTASAVVTSDVMTMLVAARASQLAVCSAADHWRIADVRDARSALRDHRLVIDTKTVSASSIVAWSEGSGIDVLRLEATHGWKGFEPTAEPRKLFLTTRLEALAERYVQTTDPIERDETVQAAEALIESLGAERILMAQFGRMAVSLGLPITYSVERARSIRNGRVARDDEERAPAPAKAAGAVVEPLKGARHSLLNFALLNLPFVDPDTWGKLDPTFFGSHQPVAEEIKAMADHLRAHPGVPRDRVSSMFMARLEGSEATHDLGKFWWHQLIADPSFWDAVPEQHGSEAEARRAEIDRGISFALRQQAKDALLQNAYAASIDAGLDACSLPDPPPPPR